ncbi:hypothetical protein D3C76_685770 [compost metagenome]
MRFRNLLQAYRSLADSCNRPQPSASVLQFANSGMAVLTIMIWVESIHQDQAAKVQVDQIHRFVRLGISRGLLPRLCEAAAFRLNKADIPCLLQVRKNSDPLCSPGVTLRLIHPSLNQIDRFLVRSDPIDALTSPLLHQLLIDRPQLLGGKLLIDRLQQITGNAEAKRLLGVLKLAISADDGKADLPGILLLPGLDHFQSIHHRHPYVSHDQIRLQFADLLQGLCSIAAGPANIEAELWPVDPQLHAF